MISMGTYITSLLTAVGLVAATVPAAAQEPKKHEPSVNPSESFREAEGIVERARKAVEKMKADRDVAALLDRAAGVFILPDVVKGALVVGGSGGEGIVLSHRNDEWVGPAFFNLRSVSLGAQAGLSQGPLVILLMSEDALHRFEDEDEFSVSAEAGLTVLGYSGEAEAAAGRGDVIVWNGQEGAFAGLTLAFSGITADEDKNRALYGGQATSRKILRGNAHDPKGEQKRLLEALRG